MCFCLCYKSKYKAQLNTVLRWNIGSIKCINAFCLHIYEIHILSIQATTCHYLSILSQAFENQTLMLPCRKHPQSVSINRHANVSTHTHAQHPPETSVDSPVSQSRLHSLYYSLFFASPIAFALMKNALKCYLSHTMRCLFGGIIPVISLK